MASPAVEPALGHATGICITGGDQKLLVHILRGTLTARCLLDALYNGKPIFTTSASTVALSDPMVAGLEDDDSLRRLLELRLMSYSYEVRSAADGVAALESVDGWTPDVAVLDVMMPRLSGLSVCREMRERPETAAVPIILLTARYFDEDIQQVMDLGGVEYMSKPFDFARLEESIQLLLGRLDRTSPRVVTLPEEMVR